MCACASLAAPFASAKRLATIYQRKSLRAESAFD